MISTAGENARLEAFPGPQFPLDTTVSLAGSGSMSAWMVVDAGEEFLSWSQTLKKESWGVSHLSLTRRNMVFPNMLRKYDSAQTGLLEIKMLKNTVKNAKLCFEWELANTKGSKESL